MQDILGRLSDHHLQWQRENSILTATGVNNSNFQVGEKIRQMKSTCSAILQILLWSFDHDPCHSATLALLFFK